MGQILHACTRTIKEAPQEIQNSKESVKVLSKRDKLFRRLCNIPIHNACVEICPEFCITHYVGYGSYDILQNNIRDYYQVICEDPGNAKKLAEVFLSEFFGKINNAKNVK